MFSPVLGFSAQLTVELEGRNMVLCPDIVVSFEISLLPFNKAKVGLAEVKTDTEEDQRPQDDEDFHLKIMMMARVSYLAFTVV